MRQKKTYAFVKERQTLTVWLDGIQIEMRVIKKGHIEIFCDTPFEPLPFSKWYELKEELL